MSSSFSSASLIPQGARNALSDIYILVLMTDSDYLKGSLIEIYLKVSIYHFTLSVERQNLYQDLLSSGVLKILRMDPSYYPAGIHNPCLLKPLGEDSLMRAKCFPTNSHYSLF